jgi:DNA polymerase III sliding clamp (beta) subunit (PCNA family)
MAKIISSQEQSSFEVIVEAETLSEAIKEAASLADDVKTHGYVIFQVEEKLFGNIDDARQWRLKWYGKER